MTQFEFNDLLCKYMSSPDMFDLIPPLIMRARSEHLHLLVAYENFTSMDGTHMAVSLEAQFQMTKTPEMTTNQ